MSNSSSNKHPPGGGRFHTINDVAEILGVSARTIRRWIRAGDLHHHRFGKAVRIAQDDLLLFQAKHRS